MTVGEKIKQRRIELNMSQDELAKKCGYKSRSSINKIELSRDLPLKKVKMMANALDLSMSYLMGWDEPKESTKDLYFKYSNEIDQKLISKLFDEKEIELINDYREATPEQKRMIVEMLAFFKTQKQDN